MTIEFILPDIGEGIVECELLEWLVSEGEHIEEDQPVAEVMTDKATVQIPAMHAGVVNKLHYAVGDIAKVHAPLFSMTPDDADANSDTHEDAQAEVKDNASETATANDSASSSASNGKHIEDFILPDIGEGIVECEIVKWNVAEGDEIEEDQAVVEVMTDKAVVEIPAKNAGTVHRLYYAQGDIAKVHSALFALEVAGEVTTTSGTDDESPSAKNNASSVVSQSSVNTQTNGSSQQSAQISPSKFSDGEYEPPIAIEGKVLASPAVRRVAREKNIDLSTVEGSGKKGRILKSDVLNLQHSNVDTSSQNSRSSAPSSSTAEKGDLNSTSTVLKGSVRTEKVRGIQAAMAKQMSASVYTIPHFTVSDELVMDNLMALRKLLKPEFEAKNVKLSFMPFFVKAMSLALNEFPVINSQLNEDATEISYFTDHNIGFAVDSKIGLLVPNIKRVQDLSLLDIAVQMQVIIEQARAGRVAGEHLKGGTISISNIGAIGGITATPVINKPEAAIVALGKTQKLPRFDDEGNVSAQNIMAVNWSGDHRIIDGATMVRFNNLWMSYLTQPEKMLMHLK
ncbi:MULTISPECIES: dihydrolipoyllysine-residue acetyltransferase [Alteromonas]|uniref:dihydrolipoyllysine-residue acetyltransferase n=1 Tax=Alteromonas TaxID=226 RepID=UPI001272C038|nr:MULTISPECIES: dihydrolipoyllysine-residue acetyltransferase [Alteromonas]CAI2390100.1 2-oxoisovalerate dehydrogenase E2 component (dihydrolipoyl transacylase) [Alteromonas macleodii]CAI3955975.1 2-oxoisovalerate dehydrogenase E2 component (dihydrolipoyl transacylase) [Alteromonas macleodii]CAI3956968.1 2-oxoisovalerate dehydrogenase E2 component (dihydrolipoyl transacylase) [Alteromonas macleodii]CAI3957025.1 2-oxoisovalerate dehydrogenase E2 component (dihydrolipoyl transacylase) [Alteromon